MKILKYIDTKINPIPEILTDKQFRELNSLKLLDHLSIRDYKIHKQYRELKKSGMKLKDRINILNKQYPELKEETIRKIIYKKY